MSLPSAPEDQSFRFGASVFDEFEKEIIDFLELNMLDSRAKDFFMADLSWCDNLEERRKIASRFFFSGRGKPYLSYLPENIKNKLLAYSL